MEDFHPQKCIAVGSAVRLKRYGSSSVKLGLLWPTPTESGSGSNRNPGRIREQDAGFVLESDGCMVKIVASTGSTGWISMEKLERIS